MLLNSIQIKAARTAIGWSQTDLAYHAGISRNAVKYHEEGRGRNGSDWALKRMTDALDNAGNFELIEGKLLI